MIVVTGKKKQTSLQAGTLLKNQVTRIFCLAGFWLYLSVSKGMRWMTSGVPADVTFWDAEFSPKPQCAREGVFNSAIGYDELDLILNAVC